MSVFAALAQRRDDDADDIEAIEEIESKPSGLDSL
jgi:hypothetical protein